MTFPQQVPSPIAPFIGSRYSVRYDGAELFRSDDKDAALAYWRDVVSLKYAAYRKGGVLDNHAEGYPWIA